MLSTEYGRQLSCGQLCRNAKLSMRGWPSEAKHRKATSVARGLHGLCPELVSGTREAESWTQQGPPLAGTTVTPEASAPGNFAHMVSDHTPVSTEQWQWLWQLTTPCLPLCGCPCCSISAGHIQGQAAQPPSVPPSLVHRQDLVQSLIAF